MTPVSGLIAHIRTHNCTHLAGLMRCPGHRRDEVCSQHSNGQGRSLFTRWVAPTPTHTRHALIHVLYTYSHVSMFEIWGDAPGGQQMRQWKTVQEKRRWRGWGCFQSLPSARAPPASFVNITHCQVAQICTSLHPTNTHCPGPRPPYHHTSSLALSSHSTPD